MTRELITSWTDYQVAIDRLLAEPASQILIFDHNLVHLQLDTPERIAALGAYLQGGAHIRIVVRDASRVREQHPRLFRLLNDFAHCFSIREAPAHLSHLRDALLLLDNKNALIRFEQDLARSKLLLDEMEEIRPYRQRFDEIWAENGTAIHASATGL